MKGRRRISIGTSRDEAPEEALLDGKVLQVRAVLGATGGLLHRAQMLERAQVEV